MAGLVRKNHTKHQPVRFSLFRLGLSMNQVGLASHTFRKYVCPAGALTVVDDPKDQNGLGRKIRVSRGG